jgi:hypothetical protein
MKPETVRALWKFTPFKGSIKRAYGSRANPRHWFQLARACRVLAFDFGLLPSLQRGAPITRAGTPIPWYTYPAIEYLDQFDFSDRTVFEYGAGNSTLFWASRARRVVSVEHEWEWHNHLSARAPHNCELLHADTVDAYVSAIDRSGEQYDVIVIDGQSRQLCAGRAVQRLNTGGVIILDNSDWFPVSSRLLRDAGLLEIDFFGFAPSSEVTSCTSLYLHPGCALPAGERQPRPGIGSLRKDFDEAWWKPEER